jgi:hypothetical protein
VRRRAAGELISRLWTSEAWRRTKATADRILLLVIAAAVAWAATHGILVARRAAFDRTVAVVHLAAAPSVQIVGQNGATHKASAFPTSALRGTRTVTVYVSLTNPGPDGVVLRGGTLAGPFLNGPVALTRIAGGYLAPFGTSRMVGTVTVDCDAAARVVGTLIARLPGSEQAPTTVYVAASDTDGAVHQATLVIDTTAYAVQGRACTA